MRATQIKYPQTSAPYGFLWKIFHMKKKLEDEMKRFNKFQRSVLGLTDKIEVDPETDIRNYAKYLLKEGSTSEKRLLLSNLRSRIVYEDKELSLI